MYSQNIRTLFLLIFRAFHVILGLNKQVVKVVDQVKDITEKTNKKVEEGFDQAQGKHISLPGLRRFIQ